MFQEDFVHTLCVFGKNVIHTNFVINSIHVIGNLPAGCNGIRWTSSLGTLEDAELEYRSYNNSGPDTCSKWTEFQFYKHSQKLEQIQKSHFQHCPILSWPKEQFNWKWHCIFDHKLLDKIENICLC